MMMMMMIMTKSKMKKKGKGKTSNVKLANKNQAKLKKKAKMKERTKMQRKQGKAQDLSLGSPPDSEVDCVESLDEEDLKYYQNNMGNISFLQGKKIGDKKPKKRKFQDEESEQCFEKTPRNNFEEDKKKFKRLLPVKLKNKIIPQSREIIPQSKGEEDENESDGSGDDKEEEEKEVNECSNLSVAQQMLIQEEQLEQARQKMALLAYSVTENPNEHISRLRELIQMLQSPKTDTDFAISKLAMVTLVEIFKDIIPDYRIRNMSETEGQQKMSKEFKALYGFEQSLLKSYKNYIQYLSSVVTKVSSTLSKTAIKNDKTMKEVANHCLCQLLVRCYHFNFYTELISLVVPCMNLYNEVSSQAACWAVKEVFRTDKLGDASLQIVKCIDDLIRKKVLLKPKVLSTLLSLKIDAIDIGQAQTKAEKLKQKQKMMKMSRREKKWAKQMDRLNSELLETKATEDKKKKLNYNTKIIERVFATYLRILKKNSNSELITVVLQGLTKFAHFVNIDFFEDLFNTLKTMIGSGNLTLLQTIQCTLTTFLILSGQGNVLNIDPVHFYKYIYSRMITFGAGESSEHIVILLNTLEEIIFKRKKQVTKHRVLAFMKRLSTLALQSLPDASIALLGVVRSLIHSFPDTDVMFDNEKSGSGVFSPETDNPEYCHAHNSSLWELALLQNHVNPDVARFAQYVAHQAPLSGKGQLPAHLSKLSAVDLYEKFHEENLNKFANSKLK
ncbi:nucleolar complex protein 3 homolog [Argonauta hians]